MRFMVSGSGSSKWLVVTKNRIHREILSYDSDWICLIFLFNIILKCCFFMRKLRFFFHFLNTYYCFSKTIPMQMDSIMLNVEIFFCFIINFLAIHSIKASHLFEYICIVIVSNILYFNSNLNGIDSISFTCCSLIQWNSYHEFPTFPR